MKVINIDVEKILDEAKEEIENTEKFYTHEEVFAKARNIINGKEKYNI